MKLDKTIKQVLENTIRTSFEKKMEEELNKVLYELDAKWEEKKEDIRREIGKQAKLISVEMFHEMNLNSIKLEFRI